MQNRSTFVEVKGVAGKFDWPADNLAARSGARHFVVLVCYEGKIGDVSTPSVWILPAESVGPFVKQYRGRRVVSRAKLLREGAAFKDDWQSLCSRRPAS